MDICCLKTGIRQGTLQTCKDMQMTDKAKKLWWELAPLCGTDTAHFRVRSSTLLQQPNRSIFLHLREVKIATLPWGTGDVPKQEVRGNKFDIFACRQPQPDKKQQIRETSWDTAPAGPRCQHLTVVLVRVLQKLAGLSHSVTCCFFCLSSQYLVTPDPANITTAIMLAWLQEGCVLSR